MPLDLFLSPYPGSLSLGAWIEPPYTLAEVVWRGTCNGWFFDGAEALVL